MEKNSKDSISSVNGFEDIISKFQEYLLTKYKCPADTYELDYVY